MRGFLRHFTKKVEQLILNFRKATKLFFCSFENNAVYPVPNKFGLQGWTTFDLKNVPKGLILDALDTAHKEILKSKKKINIQGRMSVFPNFRIRP